MKTDGDAYKEEKEAAARRLIKICRGVQVSKRVHKRPDFMQGPTGAGSPEHAPLSRSESSMTPHSLLRISHCIPGRRLDGRSTSTTYPLTWYPGRYLGSLSRRTSRCCQLDCRDSSCCPCGHFSGTVPESHCAQCAPWRQAGRTSTIIECRLKWGPREHSKQQLPIT